MIWPVCSETGQFKKKNEVKKTGDVFLSACVSSGMTSQIHMLSAFRSDRWGFPIRTLRPIENISFARKRGDSSPLPRKGKQTASSTHFTRHVLISKNLHPRRASEHQSAYSRVQSLKKNTQDKLKSNWKEG